MKKKISAKGVREDSFSSHGSRTSDKNKKEVKKRGRVGKKANISKETSKSSDAETEKITPTNSNMNITKKKKIDMENRLVQSLKEENSFLLNKINELENKINNQINIDDKNNEDSITGFKVNEFKNENFIVEYSAYEKMIKFKLIKKKDCYDYELIECSIEDSLPDFLANGMVFEKDQLPKFFFNVMQVMLGKD